MEKNTFLTENAIRILDSLTESIYVIDKEFRIVYMNKSASDVLKIKDNSLYGAVCMSLCKSERCEIGCPVTEVIRTGENVIDLQTTILDSEGNIIPIRLNASLLRNEKTEPIGGLISFKKDLKTSFDEYLKKHGHFYGIIGKSKKIRDVFKSVEEISKSNACVLITGETGVGKELIADAIQKISLRRHLAYVKVNCASLPPNLLASELFGHVRGAFTDAVKDRMGRFEYSNGGTIFLDEIGEMPLDLQSHLLRILQDGTFERLGESKTRKVDLRIIASTNKDLNTEIKNNLFREDLFYRLNVIPIDVPPLRERKEDIVFLVNYFLAKYGDQYNKKIEKVASDTMDVMLQYDWPGNIRELENVIEYAFIRSKREDYLCICCLPPKMRIGVKCTDTLTVKEMENKEKAETMLALLRQNNWNKTKVAKLLGVDRSTIHRRLKTTDTN